jgi:hypothetical protein
MRLVDERAGRCDCHIRMLQPLAEPEGRYPARAPRWNA